MEIRNFIEISRVGSGQFEKGAFSNFCLQLRMCCWEPMGKSSSPTLVFLVNFLPQ